MMKKIIAMASFMFAVAWTVVAEDDYAAMVEKYGVENIYVFGGNHDELTNNLSRGGCNAFKSEPVFMQENEEPFLALSQKKLCPIMSFRQGSLSIPIDITFVKEDVSIFGLGEIYVSEEWKTSEEYSKYEDAIKRSLDGFSFGEARGGAPKFLSEHTKDNLPVKTKLLCSMALVFNYRNHNCGEPEEYGYTYYYKNKKGKKKEGYRKILVYCSNEPILKLSNDGEIKEIVEPKKEKFQTPFGVMEIPSSSINLPTSIPKTIRLGLKPEPFFGPDYTYKQVVKVKTESELKALYQTRNGYELKSGICAEVPGGSITEKASEFYIGSTHLVCGDDAWSAVHTEVVKKNYIHNLIVDLRFIDGKVEFVIAPESH